ncbi:hypothetical protein BU26DRAFT_39353 [Trematosphaeria pertusa]|uniref:Secreted protein n=1 Tax=Trematosphaeria pertusa TaxID=390896 RepID=A0A6A6J325_9PLEO|nr:uncharacterized protein BU26DRAFT_39353 [Trematosphaeria pertusa]KAF2257245.1 hypothetical protein BU26DRAFT_39353 [Trematosphaeria pertusa]
MALNAILLSLSIVLHVGMVLQGSTTTACSKLPGSTKQLSQEDPSSNNCKLECPEGSSAFRGNNYRVCSGRLFQTFELKP